MPVFGDYPFDTLEEAFCNLYPECGYKTFIIAPTIVDEDEDILGETFFISRSVAVIGIPVELKADAAIAVCAHELARIAAPNDDHSHAWEDAFEKIFQEYSRLAGEKEKTA